MVAISTWGSLDITKTLVWAGECGEIKNTMCMQWEGIIHSCGHMWKGCIGNYVGSISMAMATPELTTFGYIQVEFIDIFCILLIEVLLFTFFKEGPMLKIYICMPGGESQIEWGHHTLQIPMRGQ